MPNATSDQDQRRRAIRELLGGGPVATQQLLVTELARRGFTATQSSVSRDLREIGAVKTARGYELEPGEVAVRVGASSEDLRLEGRFRFEGDVRELSPRQVVPTAAEMSSTSLSGRSIKWIARQSAVASTTTASHT